MGFTVPICHFSGSLRHFALAKLATSRIRVNKKELEHFVPYVWQKLGCSVVHVCLMIGL